MNIVQIGANKGNDDLTQIIGNTQPEKLVLVEPMKLHNEDLLAHYSWVNNLFLENLVIEKETGKDVEFFYHINDGPKYEVASLIREHIYPRHPNLSDEGITSFFIKSININDLFDKYNLKDIDILFIDAEGYDDTIIYTVDFEKYNIKKLYFENLHIKNLDVYSYLEQKGYAIQKNVGMYGWTSLAEKIKLRKINKIVFNSLNSISNLCEIGAKYDTDKSPISNINLRHSYTLLYDFIFNKVKYQNLKIAEIGIWKNGGIKSFLEYFPNAEIHGFEKEDYLISEAKKHNLKNTTYHSVDISNPQSITDSLRNSGGDFDIIIEDADHRFEHQVNVVLNIVEFLKPGGVLIIEDIFKSISEEEFEIKITPVKKYFDSIWFVDPYHDLQYTGNWDNDRLLVLYRNNLNK